MRQGKHCPQPNAVYPRTKGFLQTTSTSGNQYEGDQSQCGGGGVRTDDENDDDEIAYYPPFQKRYLP